jgi:medium-chain acyl-[acyl-carrier-protein] hydrolase
VTAWFVPLRPDEQPGDVRLVVFPHAGGGPAALTALVPLLPPEIEPWSVNLPGRQARLAEPPRTDLEPLVADLAADLVAVRQPYALFGYCSGALLAYLVCRRLHELDRPPYRLVVGSFAAPDVATLPRRLHLLPSAAFWERLIDYGGVPDELAEQKELWPVLEPALRADFGLFAGYRHCAGPPFGTPITVIYGAHDTSLNRGALLGWRRQSRHRPVLRELATSHWLVEEAPADLAATLVEELRCDLGTA